VKNVSITNVVLGVHIISQQVITLLEFHTLMRIAQNTIKGVYKSKNVRRKNE